MTRLRAGSDHPLPDGWESRTPTPEDIDRLVEISNVQRLAVRGSGSPVSREAIEAEAIGPGSWTRRQVVAADPAGTVWAWASVHDRATGRTGIHLTVDPRTPDAAAVARALIAWQEETATEIAAWRQVDHTLLDGLIDQRDRVQQDWLTAAGYRKVRTWLNMRRRVNRSEELPRPRPGVTIRRVGVHELEDGTAMPVAADLQAVHQMLEESFEDHFNSYRESFPEFVQRLREVPGHRWDHWWLALVEEGGELVPAGAVVCSVLPADAAGTEGSYIEYIGVHRRARGRGVAKSLLWTVIADAAARGRNRVGLEVDDASPTGADGLYRSMGWQTVHVTESWQKDIEIPATADPAAVSDD